MSKPTPPPPTDAELAILQVIWRLGPSTVRQVHEQLAPERQTGYTTTLKILQNMTAKGLVKPDRSARTHVYHTVFSQQKTQRRLILDFLRDAFDGSAQKLVMQAFAAKKPTPEEIAAIRKMLDDLQRS